MGASRIRQHPETMDVRSTVTSPRELTSQSHYYFPGGKWLPLNSLSQLMCFPVSGTEVSTRHGCAETSTEREPPRTFDAHDFSSLVSFSFFLSFLTLIYTAKM